MLLQHAATDPAPAADPTLSAGSACRQVAVGGSIEGALEYEALVTESPEDPVEVAVGMDDLCLLPHTSGTTGAPKGIMLTHANLTWNVINFLTCADFRGDDVTLAIAPSSGSGDRGQRPAGPVPRRHGGGPGRPGPRGNPPGDGAPSGDGGLRQSPTCWTPSPTPRPGRPTCPASRFVITGGAPVPPNWLIRAWLDRGVTLLRATDCPRPRPWHCCSTRPAPSPDRDRPAGHRCWSTSRSSTRTTVRWGRETGELLVRGPNVMAGYWRRPEATREVLAGGWLRTGDAARRDEEGYVWIVDRVADRFLVGGRPVYPGDVERALTGHPSVADAGVVQVPGEAGGEMVAAVVVLSAGSRATEQGLLAYAKDRLAPHQAPASVRFVDHLPKTPWASWCGLRSASWPRRPVPGEQGRVLAGVAGWRRQPARAAGPAASPGLSGRRRLADDLDHPGPAGPRSAPGTGQRQTLVGPGLGGRQVAAGQAEVLQAGWRCRGTG